MYLQNIISLMLDTHTISDIQPLKNYFQSSLVSIKCQFMSTWSLPNSAASGSYWTLLSEYCYWTSHLKQYRILSLLLKHLTESQTLRYYDATSLKLHSFTISRTFTCFCIPYTCLLVSHIYFCLLLNSISFSCFSTFTLIWVSHSSASSSHSCVLICVLYIICSD